MTNEIFTPETWAVRNHLASGEAVRHKLAREASRRPRKRAGMWNNAPIALGGGYFAFKYGPEPNPRAPFDPRPWRIHFVG